MDAVFLELLTPYIYLLEFLNYIVLERKYASV